MFNVCPGCGLYNIEKEIESSGPYAVCPNCGYAQHFVQLPLFVVVGSSGSGKTSSCLALLGKLPECVLLDCDILWRPEFNTPDDDYQAFRATWLNMAKNIGQSGRPVVLFGSAGPAQLEQQPERRYFSTLHYLALVCDNDVLAQRLRSRPGWRESDGADFITVMQIWNSQLITSAANPDSPIHLLDTTHGAPADTAQMIGAWVRERL